MAGIGAPVPRNVIFSACARASAAQSAISAKAIAAERRRKFQSMCKCNGVRRRRRPPAREKGRGHGSMPPADGQLPPSHPVEPGTRRAEPAQRIPPHVFRVASLAPHPAEYPAAAPPYGSLFSLLLLVLACLSSEESR